MASRHKPAKTVWDLSGYIGTKKRSGSIEQFSDSSSTTSGAESGTLSSGNPAKNYNTSVNRFEFSFRHVSKLFWLIFSFDKMNVASFALSHVNNILPITFNLCGYVQMFKKFETAFE